MRRTTLPKAPLARRGRGHARPATELPLERQRELRAPAGSAGAAVRLSQSGAGGAARGGARLRGAVRTRKWRRAGMAESAGYPAFQLGKPRFEQVGCGAARAGTGEGAPCWAGASPPLTRGGSAAQPERLPPRARLLPRARLVIGRRRCRLSPGIPALSWSRGGLLIGSCFPPGAGLLVRWRVRISVRKGGRGRASEVGRCSPSHGGGDGMGWGQVPSLAGAGASCAGVGAASLAGGGSGLCDPRQGRSGRAAPPCPAPPAGQQLAAEGADPEGGGGGRRPPARGGGQREPLSSKPARGSLRAGLLIWASLSGAPSASLEKGRKAGKRSPTPGAPRSRCQRKADRPASLFAPQGPLPGARRPWRTLGGGGSLRGRPNPWEGGGKFQPKGAPSSSSLCCPTRGLPGSSCLAVPAFRERRCPAGGYSRLLGGAGGVPDLPLRNLGLSEMQNERLPFLLALLWATGIEGLPLVLLLALGRQEGLFAICLPWIVFEVRSP